MQYTKRLSSNKIRPYILYSILIHIVLLFSLWWFSPINESPPIFKPRIVSEIFPLPRVVEAKPLESIDTPPPIKADPAIEDEVDEPPTPPKPSIDINSDWANIDDFQPTSASKRNTQEDWQGHQKPEENATDTTHILRNTRTTQKGHLWTTTVKMNRDAFALSETSNATDDAPQVDAGSIKLETSGVLSGISPDAAAPKIHYGSRRGDALRTTGMSNTWGGSSASDGSKVGGIYIKMMREIAGRLTAATTTDKVDIVFVVDETASMVDNIRGIRAYFDFVADAFQREKRDTSYGLVTFTDKVKSYGLTTDFGKFKNRLFKIDVDRGGDISEAGLDALMHAVDKMKFRRDAQRFFILASDAAFHDADYDGRSPYSLDEVISTLQKEQIRVEVIGLDYLPIKQIALATGGTWRAIPGKGFLEYVPPIALTEKMLSKLGTLNVDKETLGDKITVYVVNPPRPKQVTLTWKVLNPLGERCYGPFTESKIVPDDTSSYIEITPELDSTAFQTIPGIYTVIYRLENDQGHKSILRRTLTYE